MPNEKVCGPASDSVPRGARRGASQNIDGGESCGSVALDDEAAELEDAGEGPDDERFYAYVRAEFLAHLFQHHGFYDEL